MKTKIPKEVEKTPQQIRNKVEKGEFTLIWANLNDDGTYDLMNPKNLIGMTLEKALGSLKWSKQVIPKCNCFIYDPSKVSIFNEDGSQNVMIIKELLSKLEDDEVKK